MSVRMRNTRAHRDNRRAHHSLKEPRLSTCPKCNAAHLRHRMCRECGTYRGRTVVDVAAKQESRMKRREERLRQMGVDTNAPREEPEETKGKKGEAKQSEKTAESAER
ncbi:MAG: 50S ribosomal protein L32 [bacterium]|nr:50S ribosomal protein L32 [bacterium]